MPRSAFLLLLICAMLATACKKDQPSANSAVLLPLQGKWQWIQQTRSYAVFGVPFETITADSLNITEFLYMNKDFLWLLVINGQTTKIGIYRNNSIISPEGPIYFLDFVYRGKDSIVNHSLSSDNDTLYTSNIQIDSTWNVDMYVRTK